MSQFIDPGPLEEKEGRIRSRKDSAAPPKLYSVYLSPGLPPQRPMASYHGGYAGEKNTGRLFGGY